ncbi:hypothetical protein LPJ73_003390 [Coemansia sp. RSA 2703]|nr:hypothetical protein LPJ73_003390 [Coemansia sp. RSA 2703]
MNTPPSLSTSTTASASSLVGGDIAEGMRVKQTMTSLCRLSNISPSETALMERMAQLSCKSRQKTTTPTSTPPPESSDESTDLIKAETESFYRRALPEDLVSFTSPEGRKLFKESLNEGFAEGYFNLAGNFTVQSEPAYCGPSSLAMVLNALEVDPGRTWKGVWRWYSDELLESCRTESDLKANGITFDQFLCLASSHAQVIAKRGKTASREEFLRDLKYVTQRDDIFMVLSFSRPALGQTGDGHFSPIGAYHPETNQALVLDSARYKYPSWFCDVDKLYDSLQPVDSETDLPRGYFLICRRDAHMDSSLLPLVKSPVLHHHHIDSGVQSTVEADSDSEAAIVDLPERPAGVFPTKISCSKSVNSCCSPSK